MLFDCLIVGAGPAGLSAALVLGRCRRHVLICDTDQPRNAASGGLHGYLSRDGLPPGELRRIGREQLRPYESVELRHVEVVGAVCLPAGGFEATLADTTRVQSRKLLLTTGVVDELPDIPGVAELYGKSVFHCPYCDGWEMRDQPLAVYGRGGRGFRLAMKLTLWSRDLVVCSDGPATLEPAERQELQRRRIPVREEPITSLEGRDGCLQRIIFAGGPPLERRGMFFNTGQHQRSKLPERLGCEIAPSDAVRTDDREKTKVPGLYVAGDASRDVQLAIVAAAEGAKAAFDINEALLEEDQKVTE